MSGPAVRHADVKSCLAAVGPSTAQGVATAMGWTREGARAVLRTLCRKGEVRRTRGGSGLETPVYYLAGGPAPPEPERPTPRLESTVAVQARRYVREWRLWRAGRGPNPLISLGRPGEAEDESED